MQHIIKSLIDNDLYKFSMAQAVLHQYPGALVEYSFKCRNKEQFSKKMFKEILKEIDHLCALKLTPEELSYLGTIRFLKKDFIDFLSLLKLNRDHIVITLSDEGQLSIKIKGSWLLTIFFEIPVLSIVNEVYFKNLGVKPDYKVAMERLYEKIAIAKVSKFKFSEFGGRRRYSRDWQEQVIAELVKQKDEINFTGTSNVYFAMKFGIKPIGTVAHEFIMAHQQLGPRLIDSQSAALQSWVSEYRGDNGTFLTDVISTDSFLKDFDLYFAKLYDGLRHDSGDPIVWANKCIAHYESLKINPMTKTLIFSDGLDFTKASYINEVLKGRINVAMGVGTNLTNDFPDIKALNIVLKMTECNGRPVAKISDTPGKGMCENQDFIDYLKSVYELK